MTNTNIVVTDKEKTVIEAQRAVDLDVPITRTVNVARAGDLERYETTVTLPSALQYSLRGTLKLKIAGYAYLNRVVGVEFKEPREVPYRGEWKANPYLADDYVLLRQMGVYYNDVGQLMTYAEDIECDFLRFYRQEIVGAPSYVVDAETDEGGFIVTDDHGLPKVRYKVSNEDLKKAQRTLENLKTFGLRKVKSIARARVIAGVTGIYELGRGDPRPITIRLVGWRDKLTPEDRWESVRDKAEAMYHVKEAAPKPLEDDLSEAVDAGGGVDDVAALREDFDADQIGRMHGETPPSPVGSRRSREQ